MKWSGYAVSRLKVSLKALQEFAIHAFHEKRDSIVIQFTGSGKSVCFLIPIMMMGTGDFALVIIPTLALRIEHLRTLQDLKVTASDTGHQTSAKDKKEIYENIKNGEIQILVATKAFGLGINILNVRQIIHIGIPENLSLWVQELGRAGRDGNQSQAHLFINENQDLKKLSYWIHDCSQHEKKIIMDEFLEVWQYIASAFTSDCLRQFQLRYFDDRTETVPLPPSSCCVGCEICDQHKLKDLSGEIYSILEAIQALNSKGLKNVYESYIISWIGGKQEEWMARFFVNQDLEEEATFGLNKSMSRIELELTVKGLLRQCLSKNYLSLEFSNLKNSQIMTKCWVLTETGQHVIQGLIEPPSMPDPGKIAMLLLK